MGLAIYPGAIKGQADDAIQGLKDDNRNLQNILDGIAQFTEDAGLKSKAWMNMKSQLNNHVAVVQGMICANEELIQDNETLKGAVGDEELVEDELQAKIQSLQNANNSLQSCVGQLQRCLQDAALQSQYSFTYHRSISLYQDCMNSNSRLIEELEEKIEKLYTIDKETSTLFSGAQTLYSAVESGIAAIGKAWDPGTAQFMITSADSDWKNLIDKRWSERLESETAYEIEADQGFINNLLEAMSEKELDAIEAVLDKHQTISLLKDGVYFKLNKVNGKYLIQLSGPVVSNQTRKQLQQYLKNTIKDVDWKKYDVKQMTRGGIKYDKKYFDKTEYKEFERYLELVTDGSGTSKVAWKSAKSAFKENINIFNDFSISELKKAKGLKRAGKVLGTTGTFITVADNIGENLFKDGSFAPTLDGVQDTITDTGIDFLAGAGSAAAGAAVGSFFLPPIGTAVGAVAGMVIDVGLNVDIADINGDGEKDSLVDMAKIKVDDFCDWVGGFFN